MTIELKTQIAMLFILNQMENHITVGIMEIRASYWWLSRSWRAFTHHENRSKQIFKV